MLRVIGLFQNMVGLRNIQIDACVGVRIEDLPAG